VPSFAWSDTARRLVGDYQAPDCGARASDDDPDRPAKADDEAARDKLFQLRGRPAKALPDEKSANEQEDRPHPEPEDIAARDDR
jgi:hypothetical protein